VSVELVHVGNALDYVGYPISAASRAGGLIHTAGIVPFDPETGTLVEGPFELQARRVLDNLGLVLEAAGSSLDRIVMLQVILADIAGDLAAFNGVYADVFPTYHPPRYAIGAALAWPELRVELYAVALEESR
jgi:enamine deaminase RidA (YjgF/YER057c/UK114 family)